MEATDTVPSRAGLGTSLNGGALVLRWLTALALCLLPWADTVAADLELVRLLQEQRSQFRPITEAVVHDASRQLQSRVQTLERKFLANAALAKGWKAYLRWDDIARMAQAEVWPLESIDLLIERLSADELGLEWEPLVDLRRAAERYRTLSTAVEDPEFNARFDARLKQIGDAVDGLDGERSAAAWSAIADGLAWLARHEQAPQLIEEFRRRAHHDNGQIELSQRLLAALVAQEIRRQQPVRDCILGTDIHGTGHVATAATLDLLPDSNRFAASILIRGQLTTDTVGYNGPVTLFSNGWTQLHTQKRVYFDGQTISTIASESAASTNTHTWGIETRFRGAVDRLVKRVATRQLEQKKSLADSIAASHAARDVGIETDRELGELLVDANRQYQDEVRRPMLRRGVFPSRLRFATTPERVEATLLEANSGQIGSPHAPPRHHLPGDVILQLHQSAVGNAGPGYLGGVTLASTDLTSLLPQKSQGRPSKDARERYDELAFVFDPLTPVSVVFDHNEIQLKIATQEIIANKTIYPPMDISVRYRFASVGGRVRATLVGDPEIVPPRLADNPEGRLSGLEVSIRRLMRNILNRDLPKEFAVEDFPLVLEDVEKGQLRIEQLTTDGGWLTIAASLTSRAARGEAP